MTIPSILANSPHACDSYDHLTLQNGLNKINDWAQKWQMDFNVDKCLVMSITTKCKPSTFQYSMMNKPLTKVSSHPYLDVAVDSKLSFNTHVDDVAAMASKTLGLIK